MLCLDRMCQCGLHAVPWSHICILMRSLAAESRIIAGLFFSSQRPSLTILLTPYSMVWDWRVSRAEPIFFYWPKLSILSIVYYYFSFSLLSVYRLVLWGWGLRTDRLYITLSHPCTANLFYNNNKVFGQYTPALTFYDYCSNSGSPLKDEAGSFHKKNLSAFGTVHYLNQNSPVHNCPN